MLAYIKFSHMLYARLRGQWLKVHEMMPQTCKNILCLKQEIRKHQSKGTGVLLRASF